MEDSPEYYKQKDIITFGKHYDAYFEAIKDLAKIDTTISDKKTPKNIVLGGVQGITTATEFNKFCKTLFPNNQQHYIDMNRSPLSALESNDFSSRTQARLEKLPFKQGSIDLMFLDFTFTFMKPEEVESFFKKSNESLKPSGLILSIYNDPHNLNPQAKAQEEKIYSSFNITPNFYEQAELYKLAKPLKPIYHSEFKARNESPFDSSLDVFAMPDSKIPEIKIPLKKRAEKIIKKVLS